MKSKTKANDVWSQYERLLDLEAEAIMNLSEEELDEEIRGSGLDPTTVWSARDKSVRRGARRVWSSSIG